MRDSKSLQVSRTLLSILADYENDIIRIVSILPLVSRSFGVAPTTVVITITFMFHYFFTSLAKGPNICLPFGFLLFLLCGSPGRQNSLNNFFFLVNRHCLVFQPDLVIRFLEIQSWNFLPNFSVTS